MQRRDAPLGGRTDPALRSRVPQLLLDQPPAIERERQAGSAGNARRGIAQRRRQARSLAEQQEPRLLGGARDIERAAPGRGLLHPAAHAPVHLGDLERVDQLCDLHRVGFGRRQREAAAQRLARVQAQPLRQLAPERGVLGVDHDPAPPGAVAAHLDLVGEPVAAGAGAARVGRLGHVAPADLCQRVPCVARDLQSAAAAGERADDRRRLLVERHQAAVDQRQPVGAGVLEQGLDDLGRAVCRKAQPPALIRPREIDHALLPVPATAQPRELALELLADLGLAGQPRKQLADRLRALGIERHPPDPLLGVPAPARQRAQQLAQVVVVGKAQQRLSVLQVGVEGKRHEHCTIGAGEDATDVPCRRRQPRPQPDGSTAGVAALLRSRDCAGSSIATTNPPSATAASMPVAAR